MNIYDDYWACYIFQNYDQYWIVEYYNKVGRIHSGYYIL